MANPAYAYIRLAILPELSASGFSGPYRFGATERAENANLFIL